jgi:hypothetical protein
VRNQDDEAAQAFRQMISKLLDVVGGPSLNRIEGVSRQRKRDSSTDRVLELKRSTLYDYLCGKRLKTPEWALVLEILRVCREIAHQDGFPWSPDALGSDSDWHALWDGARHGVVPKSTPIYIPEDVSRS